jgi:uncharacterized protein with von Willebrand factor type A (vWA) domain
MRRPDPPARRSRQRLSPKVAKMIKLRELAGKAAHWLGLPTPTTAPAHTGAIASDRFDEMTWRDTYDQAPALAALADDLADHHDYAGDLVRDMFLAAYKAQPELRDTAGMDPSRLVNRQAISAMLSAAEFAELRAETAGDPYASAMAVLAQADAIRRILEQAKDAQQAADDIAQAQADAGAAAQGVTGALQAAGEQAGEDGDIPDDAAAAVQAAIDAAQQASQQAHMASQKLSQSLAAAAAGMRAQARAAAAKAAGQAREDAALMAAWGIGPGELERMDFSQRARLAARLRSGRLRDFTSLIGRFRQMALAQRARKVENVPGEVVGIELSGNMTRLVPPELVNLAVPGLRAGFFARYADRRLLTYAEQGETEAGQGAIIACVDCSGSMSSPAGGSGISGEAWSKAFALAMLDQARSARRDFAGILFSSADQVKVFRFRAGEPIRITDVIDFAEFFWNGGTDFETPLATALEILAAEYTDAGKQRGDIALLSDGYCGVSEDWMRAWNDRKAELGFRTFGISIGRGYPGVMEALCDNVRAISDLADVDQAADIFRVV